MLTVVAVIEATLLIAMKLDIAGVQAEDQNRGFLCLALQEDLHEQVRNGVDIANNLAVPLRPALLQGATLCKTTGLCRLDSTEQLTAWHSQRRHRVQNPAPYPTLNALPCQTGCPHAAADDRLIPPNYIFDNGAPRVARAALPL